MTKQEVYDYEQGSSILMVYVYTLFPGLLEKKYKRYQNFLEKSAQKTVQDKYDVIASSHVVKLCAGQEVILTDEHPFSSMTDFAAISEKLIKIGISPTDISGTRIKDGLKMILINNGNGNNGK